MLRKLALKKLKRSDLSFFKSFLSKNPLAKQKGFNLDLSVIEGDFFPSLRASLEPLSKRAAHVDLTMFGPGMAEAHVLARKVKRDAKNIRLNGEVVDGPPTHPNRYDILTSGDFAIMEFVGAALPTAVNVVLIAAKHAEDSAIHSALKAILPSEDDSMRALSERELEKVISDAAAPTSHPIRDWLDSALLEEIGLGNASAIHNLITRRRGRGLSPSDFKASKEAAERTGQLGEEILDQHLRHHGIAEVSGYEWVAQSNAISPFDFLLRMNDGSVRHADAKSTSGKFSNPIYLSISEIKHALSSGIPYDLFRLYEVNETTANFRVAKDIRRQLEAVKSALEHLPPGVAADALSFTPSFFDFEEAAFIVEDGEGEGENETID